MKIITLLVLLASHASFAEGEAKPNMHGQLVWRGQIIQGPGMGMGQYGNMHPGGGGSFNGYYGSSGYQPPRPPAPPIPAPVPAPVAPPVCIPVSPAVVQELTGFVARYNTIADQVAEVAIDKFERYEKRVAELNTEAGGRCQPDGLEAARNQWRNYLNERFPGWNQAQAHTQMRRGQTGDFMRTVDANLQDNRLIRRVTPEALNYLRVQRTDIEQLARRSREIVANSSRYYQTAMAIADYAYFSAESMAQYTTNLVGGFYDGYSQAVIGLAQVAAHLAENPGEIASLGNNIMHHVTSEQFIHAIRGRLVEITQAYRDANYAATGRLTGRMAWDVLPLLNPAATAVDVVAGTTREIVASLRNHVGQVGLRSEALGTSIYRSLSDNPEMAAQLRIIQQEQGLHTPLNPGRLSEVPVNFREPINEGGLGMDSTFRSSTYTARVLDEPLTLYRIQNPNSNILGRFFSPERPVYNYAQQLDNAMLPEWRQADNLQHIPLEVWEVTVPRGTTIYEGIVAAQPADLTRILGGGRQVFIEAPELNWRVVQ